MPNVNCRHCFCNLRHIMVNFPLFGIALQCRNHNKSSYLDCLPMELVLLPLGVAALSLSIHFHMNIMEHCRWTFHAVFCVLVIYGQVDSRRLGFSFVLVTHKRRNIVKTCCWKTKKRRVENLVVSSALGASLQFIVLVSLLVDVV